MKIILFILLLCSQASAAILTGRFVSGDGWRMRSFRSVTVKISGPVAKQARPNQLGYFYFGDLPAGTYMVQALVALPFEVDPDIREVVVVEEGPSVVTFRYFRVNDCGVFAPC